MSNRFDLGVSMAQARILEEDAKRDAEILAIRKKRRQELLPQERTKQVSWFWPRFLGWRKR